VRNPTTSISTQQPRACKEKKYDDLYYNSQKKRRPQTDREQKKKSKTLYVKIRPPLFRPSVVLIFITSSHHHIPHNTQHTTLYFTQQAHTPQPPFRFVTKTKAEGSGLCSFITMHHQHREHQHRERRPSIGKAGHHSPGASIFVTRKIKHNTLQYYAWKIAMVASLVVEHAWICWDLAKKLFHFLIAGTRVWVFMVARLFAFIAILMPGWGALLRYYFFDSFIIRNIDFGRGPRYRNLLDVYLPQPNNPKHKHKKKHKHHRHGHGATSAATSRRHQGKAPVIVFVSGGAWIIGYKLWSGLMARELSRAGYVVIVPDYRNFPQVY
jgi:hypothetical protein